MPPQDITKGRFANGHPQLFQLSVQFAATSTVLACEAQDQPFHLRIGSGASSSVSRGGIRPFLAHEVTVPPHQGVWLEQQQESTQLLANGLPRLFETGNEGGEQELLDRRERRSQFLTTANNGELLAQEQDFEIFLIEWLPNNMQNVEQKGCELVKRVPKHGDDQVERLERLF